MIIDKGAAVRLISATASVIFNVLAIPIVRKYKKEPNYGGHHLLLRFHFCFGIFFSLYYFIGRMEFFAIPNFSIIHLDYSNWLNLSFFTYKLVAAVVFFPIPITFMLITAIILSRYMAVCKSQMVAKYQALTGLCVITLIAIIYTTILWFCVDDSSPRYLA
uniref:7TM_GPCR_Srx domain-containing protein n=1 Tax=Rhabditophanes sp. KR3021 TaxID=114890 RepID=A0AC35U145_9BILA